MTKYQKYKWRLYADNNIERTVVEHLRNSGMDVIWVAEEPDLRRQQDDKYHYRKARQLRRYLLTRDYDFWNDQRFSLHESPGLITLTSDDLEVSKYLPVLLRKLINDYNPTNEPLYIDGMKVRLDTEGITIKSVNHDSQTVTTDKWTWSELF